MCGIAGYLTRNPLTDKAISDALTSMVRRGPDSQQGFKHTTDKHTAGLLFARLSIIDINERANQPFIIGEHCLVFNGEIYNYVELRSELIKEGVRFKTDSDTEVLLNLLMRYGLDALKKVEGMYAFAYYIKNSDKIIVARDRFGEKPLFYLSNANGIYFASETNTLRALSQEKLHVNEDMACRYLVHGYKSLYKHKQTWFTNVKELPPACVMELELGREPTVYPYYEVGYRPKNDMTLQEAVEGTKHYLIESMRIRLRSDVPIAFCLSGGIDSASLVSVAAKIFGTKIHSFSIIEDDERYDERDNIQATIDDVNANPVFIKLGNQIAQKDLEDLILYHNAPIATITYLIHSYLSREINRCGYRVAFSGTAADELFTGYYDHYNLLMYDLREHPYHDQLKSDWYESYGKFVRNPFLKDPDLYKKNINERGHIYLHEEVFRGFLLRPFLETFIEEDFEGDSLLRKRMLNELFYESTRVILHEDDLNSMRYSIENRSPFLDSKLVDFAYTIPNHLLIRDGFGKYLLRSGMKGILNDQVRLDKRKKGFNASIYSVFNFDDANFLEYLLEPSAPVFKLINRSKIIEVIKERPTDNSYSKFLFNFINLRIFLSQQAST